MTASLHLGPYVGRERRARLRDDAACCATRWCNRARRWSRWARRRRSSSHPDSYDPTAAWAAAIADVGGAARRRPRRARARVCRQRALRTRARSSSRRRCVPLAGAVDGPDWMRAGARARRRRCAPRARSRTRSRTTSSGRPRSDRGRTRRASKPRPVSRRSRLIQQIRPVAALGDGTRAGRRPGCRRRDAARVRRSVHLEAAPRATNAWCSARASRCTRRSCSSPAVSPASTCELAVREDENAIDALCRLALRAYDGLVPGRRRGRAGRSSTARSACAERRRDVRRGRHR